MKREPDDCHKQRAARFGSPRRHRLALVSSARCTAPQRPVFMKIIVGAGDLASKAKNSHCDDETTKAIYSIMFSVFVKSKCMS